MEFAAGLESCNKTITRMATVTQLGKAETASPLELAMLAALLSPDACRGDHSRDALLRAMALLRESAALCAEVAAKPHHELLAMLQEEMEPGHESGAFRLFKAMVKSSAPPPAVLTLSKKDAGTDTLRPYLEKCASFEGRTGRKSWARVRTVLDNFQAWFVDLANANNIKNAAGIPRARRARPTRGESERLLRR